MDPRLSRKSWKRKCLSRIDRQINGWTDGWMDTVGSGPIPLALDSSEVQRKPRTDSPNPKNQSLAYINSKIKDFGTYPQGAWCLLKDSDRHQDYDSVKRILERHLA